MTFNPLKHVFFIRYASLRILFTLFRLTAPPICLEATKPANCSSEGRNMIVKLPRRNRFPSVKSLRKMRAPFSLSVFDNPQELTESRLSMRLRRRRANYRCTPTQQAVFVPFFVFVLIHHDRSGSSYDAGIRVFFVSFYGLAGTFVSCSNYIHKAPQVNRDKFTGTVER